MPTVEVTSKLITIEHIRISSKRSFADVRASIEADLPKLDPNIRVMLSRGDQDSIKEYEDHGPKLFMFLDRDHGELLAIAGQKRNAVQYEIGNPITASTMTRHSLGAALYAPLRVALFETEGGEVVFEYDKPSTFFGQFGDERVTEVGRYLDRELEAALVKAAG
ncbi:DUF302 domain-containing protein [Labrys monachus]|uniref:Uncharacterized protein (DUF302 family) n=1 Tax=Labrys monachus TaxID=217067 RepID=A0ABU0FGE1_9HYPH|nr:DUF302 domain-containing protein [Labrys monachus]MDQ0393683.1 uncharacterized protein (DUF302 family) [Labrys monachus]